MNIIYDERTPHSRLVVGYDRYGITIKQWGDEVPDEDSQAPFYFEEGFYSWERFKARKRCYCGDDGTGKLKQRIVAGAISLMAYWGPSSDSCGEVDSLDTEVE